MLLRPCSGDSPPRLAIGNGALPVPTGLMKPQQESGIFCAFQALRVLTGITRIPQSLRVSVAWSASWPCFFYSLFLVFGLYLFLRVSVRHREFVLVIAK